MKLNSFIVKEKVQKDRMLIEHIINQSYVCWPFDNRVTT